ncbi:hypothetical protein IQ249_05685 [Lusitaniella coriacea LEGE 07157]|uniref:DnaD domain-containing protein n=1 Tax=Lusitaniella coriacea LEGE 07157 TaxID=945747 RepID=A0A8J7DT57_9CYAN|nr:hypothetical protein [Lusitaniella coriacea]MBE9115387.1 hypothetical protein [Lusitaniella coriacea LEGE 07157]
MTDRTTQAVITQTVALIERYGFETGRETAMELVTRWLERDRAIWVRLAVIEALYQGRYKAVSVEQILQFWIKRGYPTYHFNHEFESLICRRLPPVPPSLLTKEPEKESEKIDSDRSVWVGEAEFNNVQSLATSSGQKMSEGEENISHQAAEEEFEKPLSEEEQETPNSTQEWARLKAYYRPIHKFSPPQDDSRFYDKLKKVTESQ